VRKIVSVEVSWIVYKKSGTANRTIRAQTVMFKDITPSSP
jgi:hypothetical protein